MRTRHIVALYVLYQPCCLPVHRVFFFFLLSGFLVLSPLLCPTEQGDGNRASLTLV